MKIPILMYHQVDNPPQRGAPLRGLIVSPSSFARQMLMLKLAGFKGLSMRDMEPYLKGDLKGKVVGITFDDGFQNIIHYALPVLVNHGFTATCYGVSQAIDGKNTWDIDLGIQQKPLMNKHEWELWLKNGMDVGSHTRHHVDLTKLSKEQAVSEIAGSKSDLQDLLDCEVRHFCYPYGWFNSDHKILVKEAGYMTATTTQRGRIDINTDFFELKRIMIARSTHLGLFAAKLLTSYEDSRT